MTFDYEKKAISVFVNTFGGSFQKLDPLDIDYKIFDKDGKLVAYAEIAQRIKTMRTAYPLFLPARKLVKLIDKRIAPVLIWHCEDGIIYAKANAISGQIKFFEDDLFVFYDKQKEFKYVRFT